MTVLQYFKVISYELELCGILLSKQYIEMDNKIVC